MSNIDSMDNPDNNVSSVAETVSMTVNNPSLGSNDLNSFLENYCKMDSSNMKIGICGFVNIGNTCYMNSTLQSLIHSRAIFKFMLADTNPFLPGTTFAESAFEGRFNAEFIKYLRDGVASRLYEKEKKRLASFPNVKVTVTMSQWKQAFTESLTIKLAEIINRIVYKGISTVIPTSLKAVIDKKIPAMKGYMQQDAHELLDGLLDSIINETGVESHARIKNTPQHIIEYITYEKFVEQRLKDEAEELTLEEKKELENSLVRRRLLLGDDLKEYKGLKYMQSYFARRYNPLIFKLQTILCETLKCTRCNIESNKFSEQPCLLIDINPVLARNPKPTLGECFENMKLEEKITRNCEYCGNVEALRTCEFWRPGAVLYIELKRFLNNAQGHSRKISDYIDIPNTINIHDFCAKNNFTNGKRDKFDYQLKCIVNHMGSLQGGHYNSDAVSVVDGKTWFHFDDSRVEKYDGDEINKSNSYVLMYELK